MATLKDLFESKMDNIYSKFSPSETQGLVIKPNTQGTFGSNNNIKNDTRALPIISTQRDVRRVSTFLTSPEGKLFIGKQVLLQTGNTFSNTKIFNPLSPVINAVPFIHAKRHFELPTFSTPRTSGLLQVNTVDAVSSRAQPSSGGLGAFISTNLKAFGNAALQRSATYNDSRPEYKAFGYSNGQSSPSSPGPILYNVDPLSARGLQKAFSVPKNRVENDPPSNFAQQVKEFKQKFYTRNPKVQFRLNSAYIADGTNPLPDTSGKDGPTPTLAVSKKTEIRDPYNINRNISTQTDTTRIDYNNIYTNTATQKKDIIKFIFKDVTGNNPVYFRAFLSSIKEMVKPEFYEQRYVGRTERFVTYGGSKRGVNLSFNIVAFSTDEADGMWSKINYLTGLTFPKDVSANGFMIPPLFQITVGNIYENQPCYIESLDYEFLDDTTTFDIDNEVPFVINVNMQLSILERRSRFHDSPFYKITETIAAKNATDTATTGTQQPLTNDADVQRINDAIANQISIDTNLESIRSRNYIRQ